jgi:proteasome assembly chaperone (PAC2) family protein
MKISFFHTDIYREPDNSLCHKAYKKHNQANVYVILGPHTQATTQCVSLHVYVEVPQFMGSLNTYNMHTLHGTVLGTSSTTIRNYNNSVRETGTGGNF